MSRTPMTAAYRGFWPYLRLTIFWIAGARSTIFASPDQPQWEVWIGWILLALAVLDTALLIRQLLTRRPA